jgi:hypothetical protein
MKGPYVSYGMVLRRWLAAAALAGASVGATADTLTKDTAGGYRLSVGTGSAATINLASPGTAPNLPAVVPAGTPATRQVGPAAGGVGNTMTIPAGQATGTASGSPQVHGRTTVPIPKANRGVVIDVKAKIVKPSAAKALAKFAMKNIPIISNAYAIGELLQDLGVTKNANGELEHAGSAGLEYHPGSGWPFSGWYSSQSAMCAAIQGYFATYVLEFCTVGSYYLGPTNAESTGWRVYEAGYSPYGGSVTTRTAPPTPNVLDESELEGLLNADSLTSDKAQRAITDAINSGESIETETPTVTGPASVPGATTTKSEVGPAGTTTSTTNTTHNVTYEGNKINFTTVNITNVTHPNGTTTTTTETKEEEPEDPCAINPDSIACKDLDVPDGEVPKKTENITFSVEASPFGAGACPANPTWSDSLGAHTINLAPYCSIVVSVVRPVVLAFAALAALMICMAAVKGGD